MDLAELLQRWADDLVSDALAELRQARLKHYEANSESVLHDRVATFFERATECVRNCRADPIVDYTAQIARERYNCGYDLYEVQTAINVLEEALWRRILNSLEPGDLAHALGLVNAIFGIAKDVLAQTYVSLVEQQQPARVRVESAPGDRLEG